MTYTIAPGTPKAASAAAFGRELVRALETRGIPRQEIHRATGIGRTALDHYRVGASLPRTAAAVALATALDWPRLAEIVRKARTRACSRCGTHFRNDGGNMGAKRYCSPSCREVAASERDASTRARQAGQTGDGRRRYQEVARLRSGIRIAEERSADLLGAIADMCASCEPEGACRTADCALRAFSPLPLATHRTATPATREQSLAMRTAERWTPAARAAQSAMTRRLHAEGRIPTSHFRTNHPAHDPERREAWLAALRAGKARRGHTGGRRKAVPA
ncbi:MAG: hypothetical protein V4515_12240 [Chloroflexota bacterium]